LADTVEKPIFIKTNSRTMVYLLHFNTPYKHAAHYLGYASNLSKRVLKHATKPDARLMQVIKENNIGFVVARVWPDADRNEERRLKNTGSSKRFCPICNEWHELIFKTRSKTLKPFTK
jgi:predicted GIY-YIG superfamily endonuclease